MFEFVFLAAGLEGGNSGGIQYSGQLAWSALCRQARTHACSAALLSYGDEPGVTLEDGCRLVRSRSRLDVLAKALCYDWTARQVLCWHRDLAKLLPFLRVGPARISLFLHGIEAWQPLGTFARRSLRGIDQLIANSEFTWQRFLECNRGFARIPCRVVPLGIGDPVVEEPPPPAEPPAALMLGRLVRSEAYKGHAEIISVWPRVRAQVPGAKLWVAGDGDLRPDLEQLARSGGCADSVVFWGRVSEAKKAELLEGSRCLAMPSRGEGFGLVYLEAMRLGRPCLVSNQDAGREVVRPPEAGLEADPADPEALTSALRRLLQAGPEWNAWSAAARRRYEACFTAAHFQARLLDALVGDGPSERCLPEGKG
jgi:phosphatidylinositol alpha-1,6-mannosyltransferase